MAGLVLGGECTEDRREEVVSATIADRIEKRLDRRGECWLWYGDKNDKGYAQLRMRDGGGRTWLNLRRYVWETTHGPIPDGMLVCHSCDTPSCLNPEHLWLGTHQDNMNDSKAKGRLFSMSRGEANKSSKLKEVDVLEMWKLKGLGYSHKAIGEQFGVCSTHVGRIFRGDHWAWLEH